MAIYKTEEERDYARRAIEGDIRRGYNLRRLMVTQEEVDELGIVYDGEVKAFHPDGRPVTWEEYRQRTGKDY